MCEADRLSGRTGVCGSDAAFRISSLCVHTGEEPAIGGSAGICNVFFSRCNLSCIYCQNYQISKNRGAVSESEMQPDQIVDQIVGILDRGIHAVGFVSPSHFVPQVKILIEEIRLRGYNPVFVYNTNAYDLPETIASLNGYIDVYLPDYKYADNGLAQTLSKVKGYRETALRALREMYFQKGSALLLDEEGRALNGIIIRHLVLPGYVENSLAALQDLADISVSLTVSLLAQYNPVPGTSAHPSLSRPLQETEYQAVRQEMDRLGFYKGWTQELESRDVYRPDFEQAHPFER
jgi:putative pyruvate formate lyase activating enzyme